MFEHKCQMPGDSVELEAHSLIHPEAGCSEAGVLYDFIGYLMSGKF